MFARIVNTPRDYAWGAPSAISDFLGHAPSGAREAELWLGAHPGSPARLISGEPLPQIVEGRMPFLLKVLAARSPLSLQAHPTPEQARAGFARENAEGVPLQAPTRNYKDEFHKPELMFAVSEKLTALSGFRPVAETLAVLGPVLGEPAFAPVLARLHGEDPIRTTFHWLITGGDDVDAVIAAAVRASAMHAGLSWQTVERLSRHYPGDAGIAISLLLHTVELSAGEVLYLPAGNIHAYLEGVGVELMAASDNVLRGGLTPKHVDVDELMRVLDFTPIAAPLLRPEQPEPGVRVYRPDVPDFVLTVIDATAETRGTSVRLSEHAVVLCTEGQVRLNSGRELTRGQAAFIQNEGSLTAEGGAGRLFVATSAAALG